MMWQFKILMIPRSWLDAGGDVESLFEEGDCDVSIGWAAVRAEPALEEAVGALLPLGKSWSAALTMWGHAQSDGVELRRERGRISSLGVRFDLRNANIALFEAVVGVARTFHLAIVVPGARRIIDAEVKSLLRAAAESDAAHFVLDPQSFLAQVAVSNAKAT